MSFCIVVKWWGGGKKLTSIHGRGEAIRSGQIDLIAFERQMKNYLSAKHVAGCSNWNRCSCVWLYVV